MTDDPMTADFEPSPKFIAAFDLLGRSGATQFQIRYCDDQQPVIWMAAVSYKRSGTAFWEAAGATDPETATLRLCEIMIDVGICTHCHRGTGFVPDLDEMPTVMGIDICWYQWDPELATFRRGCE
jgi:hypothetical protein